MNLSPSQALFRALLATAFFCCAPACVKAVDMNAYTLGIARLGMASLGVMAWLIWQGKFTSKSFRGWSSQTWKAMVLVGLAFGLHWLFFFLSIKWADANIGAIGFSTYGIHLLLLGWLLGRGTVGVIDLAGIALALAGTLLLIPEFSIDNQQTLGLAIGVLSGLAAAALPLLHQHFSAVDNDLRTWGQFTFALPLFCIFFSQTDWHVAPDDWLLVLFLGFGIALVGHGLWIQATTALSTTTTSILSYLYLPGSLLVNFLAFEQSMDSKMLIGTACVLVANGLVLWNQKKLRALEAQVPETT